ncbi:MAG: phosphatase PAP2 family protein [Alphaproteobacteria bacterium]
MKDGSSPPPAYALAAFAIVSLGLAAVLFLVPEIDLWIHGFFYRQGDGFFLKGSFFARFSYKAINWATPVLVVASIAVIGIGLIGRMRRWVGLRRPAIVLLACLAIGSGLIVNGVLKDNWGRARPSQITQFGGSKAFTPPFVIADQCKKNCSFVAGHPSIPFAFFGLALFVRRRRRRALALAVVAGIGGLAGLGRMMQGAHFFSDVVYSGVFMFITGWLLYRLTMAVPDEGERILAKVPPALRRAGAELWALIRQLLAFVAAGPIDSAPPRITVRRIAAVALSGTVVAALCGAGILWIDRPFAWLLKEHAAILDIIFKPFSALGEPTMWVGVFSIMGVALLMAMRRSGDPGRAAAYRRAWHQSLFLLLCTGIASAVVPLVKIAFGRARTRLLFNDGVYEFRFFELDSSFWSFPSGHVATIAAAAVAFYLLWPRFARYYVAIVALVAVSRLVQTVHFLSDVIISVYLSTLICLMIKIWFERRGVCVFDREADGERPPVERPRRVAPAE